MRSRVQYTEYGAAALATLRRVVAEAKRADPLAPVTLLAPNNIAGVVARRHLAHGLVEPHTGRPSNARTGVAGLHIATLARLAEQIAAPHLAPRRPATRPVVAAAWRRTLHQHPGVFATVAEHPATVRALTEVHRELRDLSGTALDDVATGSALAADVVRLHREVTASLAEGWYDQTDLLHVAAELVATSGTTSSATERGHLALYLPQDLTRAEIRFASALAEHAELTVVAALTGVERADRAVRRTLDRLGLEPPTAPPQPPTADRVLHASDSDDEVRCVVREVVAALEATPAHRIAVLHAAAAPYSRLLHEHLSAAGIAVNGPGSRAVHERALARGLLAVLALPDAEFGRAEVFEALSEAPTRDAGGDRVPVARWERLSRLAAVVRGDDWDTRLTAYADSEREVAAAEEASDDPRPGVIERARRQAETAETLRAFVHRLRARLRQGEALTSWSELGAWTLDLFHELYGEPDDLLGLPPEEQYAAVTMERAVRGLADLDSFLPGAAALQDVREILALELEAALPRVGRFGEGVFVGPLSAAIGLEVDRLFVVGLAEDAYPGRLHEDALLPQRVRSRTDELPPVRERLDARHRHLLTALHSGASVTASFPRGDLRRSTGRLPSRFLLPSLRKLTGDKELAATEWDRHDSPAIVGSPSYAATLRNTPQLATEQEWRVRAAVAGLDVGDDTIEAGRNLLRARGSADFTRFDGNLRHVDGLPDYARGDRAVSPTALEAYAECPHSFFVQRLLRVEPVEHPEEIIAISPLDIGNLVHEVMDTFVRELADELPSYGRPWTAAQCRRLLEIADGKAREYETRGLTGHRLLWEQERARIMADATAMLDDDDRWRAQRDARVLRSELAFGKDGARPVVVEVPGGGRVSMRGSADKVDETRDGVLLVTDLKTGRPDNFRVLREDPVAKGTKLQLPVYALAARQLLGGDRVEAAYWFVRRNRGERIEVPLDDDVQQRYAQTIGTLVASIAAGLFPARAPATADYLWVQCPYCNPDRIGHGDVRERWERKRHDVVLREYVELVEPEVGASQPQTAGGEA